MDVRVGLYRKLSAKELILLNCGVGEDSWESLNCKEIKPVSPKENQPSIFIGRTDAEVPILWPPDGKSWLIWKDPDGGKDWGQEDNGMTEDEMVEWHHWLNADEFEHEFLSSRSKVIIPFKCSHSFSHLLPVLLAKNSQLNYSPVAASDKQIWLT